MRYPSSARRMYGICCTRSPRHLGAIRLVAAILRFFERLRLDVELADRRDRFRLLIADRRRAHIEHRRQILRRKIVAQLAQHVDENICRRRRNPRLRGHRPLPRHRVIGAKNERHRIDQENPRPWLPAGRWADGQSDASGALVCGGDFFLAGNWPSLTAIEFFARKHGGHRGTRFEIMR